MKLTIYIKKYIQKLIKRITDEDSERIDLERNYSKYMSGYRKTIYK